MSKPNVGDADTRRRRSGTSMRGAELCSAVGFFLTAGGAVFRAITTLSPFPAWELDPLVVPVPHTGLGPGGSMIVDSIILAGAMVIMVGEWLRGARISLIALVLLMVGTVGLSISHVYGTGEPHVAQSWIAAMTLGIAMAHLCRQDRYKRMALAVLVSIVVLLAIRGAQQVLIEHPQTMQEYRRNRERFLDAQGWTHDSPMAKSYERRIIQNDAAGWFGLSNVYATFAAGGATAGVALVALTLRLRRARPRAGIVSDEHGSPLRRWWFVVLPCASIGALVLADAKGGVAAFLLGLVFAGAAVMVGTRQSSLLDRIGRVRIGAFLALGSLVVTLSLIVARGLMGTRLGELSLLFRWYYLDAAARIGLQHFPLGCGADGFKPWYSLLKNPLSPENVSSSHNMLSDFWACGGVLAVSWMVLWLWWVASAGRGAVSAIVSQEVSPPVDSSAAGSHLSTRAASQADIDFRVVAGVGVIATLVALRLDSPIMTPDLAVVRIAGMLAWCAIAWLMLGGRFGTRNMIGHRAVQFTLSAAAVAMATHALIDQAGVWPSSAPLLMFFIGAAGARVPNAAQGRARILTGAITLSLLVAPVVIVPGGVAGWRVFRWERLMIRAAEVVYPASEVSNAWQDLNTPGSRSMSQVLTRRRELRMTLEQLTGRVVKDAPEAVHDAVEQVVLDRVQKAIVLMRQAQELRPGHFKTQRELSRLELVAGQRLWLAGNHEAAQPHLDRALVIAVHGLVPVAGARANNAAPEAVYFNWVYVVRQTRFDLTKQPDELAAAIPYLEHGAKLDPYGLEYPTRLMKLHLTLGNKPEATRWAAKALELNELQRLDNQVQGLRESDKAQAERLTGIP